MARWLLLLLVLCAALAPVAQASPSIRYGVQDDAWLQYGPGTLDQRLDRLQAMGVDMMRVTVDWRATEPVRAGKDDWARTDLLLAALHERGIAPLVTLWGTPGWANGHKAENVAPTNASTFAAFARRIALRYPYVKLWTVWNEPNQRRWLQPTSPTVYTTRLLNPAYAAIHAASPGSKVAGGVTAPRGSTGGVSPVDWIAGMAKAHARLDAYAHNPYPLARGETPTTGGCDHCTTITMATLPRLLSDVQRAFGTRTRIWLTEYGYQTNPPDAFLGVSYASQAQFTSEAALRALLAPRVDVLIHYLVRDEPNADRWQSGLFTVGDIAKPSYNAFRFPLAQLSATTLWGQIRPGTTNTYALQRASGGSWVSVGGTATTNARGYFTRRVNLQRGQRYRVWVPSAQAYSPILTVR